MLSWLSLSLAFLHAGLYVKEEMGLNRSKLHVEPAVQLWLNYNLLGPLDIFSHLRIRLCSASTTATSSNHSPYRYRLFLPPHTRILSRFLYLELDCASDS